MKPYILIAALVAGAVSAAAQTAPQVEEKRVEIIKQMSAEGQSVPGAPVADVLRFVSSEFAWREKIVKNAPYSAEAVTRTTQTLADGNRIVNENTARVYRDSEGRTRREQTLGHIGPWASQQPHTTIFINDPVAGVSYVLDPQNSTARKIAIPPKPPEGAAEFEVPIQEPLPPPMVGGGHGGAVFIQRHDVTTTLPHGNAEYKNESLGKQTVEGVLAEGTRTTVTIPAGQIGNERPIVTASERWHSPELQTVVMSKRNDPRFGETVYRLANLQRSEPSRSLFEPPPDYTVTEEKPRTRTLHFKKE